MTSSDPGPELGQAATRSVRYIRVYTDADNRTRFEDPDYAMAPVDFVPPAPPVFASTPQEAAGVVFLALPQGWTDPAHPSPGRQLALFLSGEAIGTAGDEERRIGPGTVVLLEDTTGPGHGLTALTDVVMAVVRLGP
jgi:quercetin dioxygenase-like cupin family protein